MSPANLVEYANPAALNDDEIYTIELLLDLVEERSGIAAWDEWSRRQDARREPAYIPSFDLGRVPAAASALSKLEWCSLQRVSKNERPVRDVRALRYLPSLTGLVLSGNEIEDISALAHCPLLRTLSLSRNRIRDLSPLKTCLELAELDLRDTPIEDFFPLLALTDLRKLEISDDQLPVFCRLPVLSSVWELEVTGDGFPSFESFPEMPNLREIRSAKVASLAGIERLPNLQNITNLGGTFDSLDPLSHLKRLTHLNSPGDGRVHDLAPLGRLYELRSLWLATDEPTLDLAPLTNLPALHDVTIRCGGEDHPGLAELSADLPSWDVEFLADSPRYTPSSAIEIVSPETFDHYDTKARFGVIEAERNHRLIESELEWLDDRISAELSSGAGRFLWWGGLDLTVEKDYSLPFRWGGGRSRTLMLHSKKALKAFPHLVGAIQGVLARARNDWIIYLQTDIEIPERSSITAWIYPDRVQTTTEYEGEVRKRMR